ncbi:hypothetical protein BS17DRAFT_760619 [Gyrodon lividus]|nr:hypothetical protein BS17DRAFT_760619 [Gyrodon lividus]
MARALTPPWYAPLNSVVWQLLPVDVLGKEHIRTYETVATMAVESAAMYFVLGIIFLVTFVLYSNVLNPVFLAISHVQGISQLLIIIRITQGRALSKSR